MRDLVRARGAAVDDLKSKRQQILSQLLQLGRHYPGKRTWTRAHMIWLVSQKLAHREQRIALEEIVQVHAGTLAPSWLEVEPWQDRLIEPDNALSQARQGRE